VTLTLTPAFVVLGLAAEPPKPPRVGPEDDPLPPRAIARIRNDMGFWGVAFSPDGRRLACSTFKGISLRTADTLSEVWYNPGEGVETCPLFFAPDGKTLAAGTYGGIDWFDAATGKHLRGWKGRNEGRGRNDPPEIGLVMPDLRSVVCWHNGGRDAPPPQVLVVEVEAPRLLCQFNRVENDDGPDAISPDGRFFACCGRGGGSPQAYDLRNGRPLAMQRVRFMRLRSLVFSPDSRSLFAVDPDGGFLIWEVSTGGLRRIVTVSDVHQTRSLTCSPDGRTVVLWSEDGTILLWDLLTNRETGRFTAHPGPIIDLAVAPDGKRLATAGEDKTAVIWDIADLVRKP
jgi:WD40 repeat protein